MRSRLAGQARAGKLHPAGDGITVFFSVGLAGTEAVMLDRLAQG